MSAVNGKKVILVVDDVSMSLFMIKNLLSDYFDVRVAKSGDLALNILNNVKVDLILLDIEMPEMSGFDFIDIVRKNPDSAETPIICVTSHAELKIINKAIISGVKDYIIKPLDANVLKQKVFNILDKS